MSIQKEFFSKKFLVVLLAISILANVVLITKQRYPDFANKIQIAILPAPKVEPGDHVRGNPKAKYTIIEYADFQCPYCTRFHEAMNTLMKETDVRWVYRHYPIKSHPLAHKAAEASECAGEQGKFWEYADALFALKGKMTDEMLFHVARELGLDGIAFGACLSTGKQAGTVAAQRQDGENKKITGTPTFYLNGKRFNGFVPLEELRKMMGVNQKQ